MKILREVHEGECFPSPWWGMCWHDYSSRRTVIAPIGLNLLFAFAQSAHGWAAFYLPAKLDRMRRRWENDRKVTNG